MTDDVRLSDVDWKAVHAFAASPKTSGAIAFAIVSETAHTMATVLGISSAQFDTGLNVISCCRAAVVLLYIESNLASILLILKMLLKLSLAFWSFTLLGFTVIESTRVLRLKCRS